MNDVKQTAPAGVRVPELLAPAGDWDCVKAAVETGADAIYFGLDKFNARMRAKNFTVADLPELMAYLHLRGVRGYVTFNTLVFSDELADAEAFLRSIIAAGVDAAIVQDVGICRLIRRLSPDFPIHASTQMTVSRASWDASSPCWRGSVRSRRSNKFRPRRRIATCDFRWRCLCMARCAWLIPGSA